MGARYGRRPMADSQAVEAQLPAGKAMRRKLFIGLLLGVLVVVGMGLYADGRALLASLTTFNWVLMAPVLGLTLINWLLRFIKWQYYLHLLGHRVPWRPSGQVFLAGFSMAVTPGKFGELLKAVLLRDRVGTPATDTASVVIGERATDFIALVLLAAFGVLTTQHGTVVLAIGAAGSAIFLAVASSERLALWLISILHKLPGGSRIAPKVEALYRSIAKLVRPVPLFWTTALSVTAWACECLGFYLVLKGVGGSPDLATATFVYAFATIFGAVTLLPGGLGATEGSLIGLTFGVFALAGTREAATAAALIIRFATLWFAVIVGLFALGTLQRHPAAADSLTPNAAARQTGPRS